MGEAWIQRSSHIDVTANSITEQDDISARTASAFASLLAAASVGGAHVRRSTKPIVSQANHVNAGSARFARSVRPSVSLRVFSAGMVDPGSTVGARRRPAIRLAEPAPARKSDQLLLQKLHALEQRIRVLEVEIGAQQPTSDPGERTG
jgi:hypothetical protein